MKTNVEAKVAQKLSILPSFVNEDYPLFRAFLDAYYRWESEQGADLGFAALKGANDIDLVIDELLPIYKNSYAKNVPPNMIGDFRHFAKHLKEFYQLRGTPEAVDIYFRATTGESSTVEYPKERVFKPSDAVWNSQRVILVETTLTEDQIKWKRFEDGNSAFSVSEVTKDGNRYQLVIEDVAGAIGGTFGPFAVVQQCAVESFTSQPVWNDGDEFTAGGLRFRVDKVRYGKGVSVAVKTGGTGYAVGEVVTWDGSALGSGLKARVTAVNGAGAVTGLQLIRSGFGYTSKDGREVWETKKGKGCTITPTFSPDMNTIQSITILKNAPFTTATVSTTGVTVKLKPATEHVNGFWSDERQRPSSKHIHIHDSDYYQEYSYVVKTASEVVDTEALRSLLHIAGQKMFIEKK